MRELYKNVEIDGKKFRVKMFTALDGGTVFLFVVRKILPLLKAADIDFGKMIQEGNITNTIDEVMTIVVPVLDSITKEDLQEFMALCLAQVEMLLPAGYEKVYKQGGFAVDEVAYSTKLAFILCYHAIEGIVTDFFGDRASKFLENLKQNMNPSNLVELTHGSTDQ